MTKRTERKGKPYKNCVVPRCLNTTLRTPEKLFFSVPANPEIRKKWFDLARRANHPSSNSVNCCEDHFNLEEDVENLMRYRLMGQKPRLKPDVYPHKFKCQRRKQIFTPRKLMIGDIVMTKKVVPIPEIDITPRECRISSESLGESPNETGVDYIKSEDIDIKIKTEDFDFDCYEEPVISYGIEHNRTTAELVQPQTIVRRVPPILRHEPVNLNHIKKIQRADFPQIASKVEPVQEPIKTYNSKTALLLQMKENYKKQHEAQTELNASINIENSNNCTFEPHVIEHIEIKQECAENFISEDEINSITYSSRVVNITPIEEPCMGLLDCPSEIRIKEENCEVLLPMPVYNNMMPPPLVPIRAALPRPILPRPSGDQLEATKVKKFWAEKRAEREASLAARMKAANKETLPSFLPNSESDTHVIEHIEIKQEFVDNYFWEV